MRKKMRKIYCAIMKKREKNEHFVLYFVRNENNKFNPHDDKIVNKA